MCKWFLGSIRICLPKRHTLYRSFLLNHESRQDGKCTVATVSGDDAILDDVEDRRGVVESGRVLVDPAVSGQVLVVDVHRHTRRRDHTVVQTGLGRRHAPVLLAVERVCVGAVPPAHRTHCIIVIIIVFITIIIISSFIIDVVIRNFHTRILRQLYITVATYRHKFNSDIR